MKKIELRMFVVRVLVNAMTISTVLALSAVTVNRIEDTLHVSYPLTATMLLAALAWFTTTIEGFVDTAMFRRAVTPFYDARTRALVPSEEKRVRRSLRGTQTVIPTEITVRIQTEGARSSPGALASDSNRTYIVLCESALTVLKKDELCALFAHEIGHLPKDFPVLPSVCVITPLVLGMNPLLPFTSGTLVYAIWCASMIAARIRLLHLSEHRADAYAVSVAPNGGLERLLAEGAQRLMDKAKQAPVEVSVEIKHRSVSIPKEMGKMIVGMVVNAVVLNAQLIITLLFPALFVRKMFLHLEQNASTHPSLKARLVSIARVRKELTSTAP